MLFKDWIFFFFISTKEHAYSNTHTNASWHFHTHTVHDQVARVVRKWEALSVKRRNDVGSVRPAYTQKLIGKTFIGKNYSKPLSSFSSQALNEKACGEILWSEFCEGKGQCTKTVSALTHDHRNTTALERDNLQYFDITQLLCPDIE